MNDILLRQLELKADLRDALARAEFELVYQPVMNLWTGAMIGVEALLRWRHPTRGTVLPDEFVPLAEEIGEMTPLGDWALREACRHIAHLHCRTVSALQVAINLAIGQLQSPDLISSISAVLAETGLKPAALVLEIAETAIMQDPESTIDQAHALKAMGLRLAIDDFGAGYSSLSYLKRLPLTELTWDRMQAVVEGQKGDKAPATRNRYYQLLRSILRRAMREWNWIDSVPTMNTTIESTPMPSLRKSWISKTMAPITPGISS